MAYDLRFSLCRGTAQKHVHILLNQYKEQKNIYNGFIAEESITFLT